jgi:peptidoglycan/LPS O-acetylase OafA/YrhL
MKFRSATLDLLRVIACFWVVIDHFFKKGTTYNSFKVHYDFDWWPRFLFPLSNTGLLGVDIFFILSGAVIAKTALNSTPRRFAESRFLRLFPMYFLATLMAIMIAPIVSNGSNPVNYWFGLTGLQFWAGGPTIVGAAWTLPYEIGFYFIVFFVINYLSRNKKKFSENSLFGLLVSWTIITVLAPAFEFQPLDILSVSNFSPYFILGACLSQITNLRNFKKYFVVVIFSAALSEKVLISRVPEMQHKFLFSFILLPIVILIILSSNFRDLSTILPSLNRPLETLSLMTYPIYLLHVNLGMGIVSKLYGDGLSSSLCYLTAFSFTLFVSWFSVKYYEPQFRKFYKKYLSLQE